MLTDLPTIAVEEGLRYVNDDEPGIGRVPHGDVFTYSHFDGRSVSSADLQRIAGIVIPPAWSEVWICRDDIGHIQATGRDGEARKQDRYHSRWEELRERDKFESLADFGDGLLRLRKAVDCDLRRHEPDRIRVAALAVAVLDRTLIRVGNPASAKKGSFGLTTLKKKHVESGGSWIALEFVGKGGADHSVRVSDRRIADHLKRIQELPGQHLFDYRTDQGRSALRSEHINEYLLDRSGIPMTAKDFRTWGASSLMTGLVMRQRPEQTNLLSQIDAVSDALGNTRDVARDSYIHPQISEWYATGTLETHWRGSRSSQWMDRSERTLLRCLEK